MPRRLSAIGAVVAALTLASSALASAFPDENALPNGWRPEGIAVGRGLTAYVGSLGTGGIATVDLRTGDTGVLVTSATGPAVGLEYEAGADRLWVAGGPSAEVRVYDASTGALLETYSFAGPARFVNDIVVTRDAAYATDSMNAELIVIPLGPGGSLPDPGDAFTLALGGQWAQVDGFNANGIEEFAGFLIIPNSTTGQLFVVNPATGEALELLPPGAVPNADGLLLVGSTLYVVQNQLNLVSVWRIKGGVVAPIGTITQDDVAGDLDIPTTVAFAAGSLWAVNARFSTPPTGDTAYWITRIPRN